MKLKEALQQIMPIPSEPAKVTNIRVGLTKELLGKIVSCLRENQSTFAWDPSDMPGISPSVVSH